MSLKVMMGRSGSWSHPSSRSHPPIPPTTNAVSTASTPLAVGFHPFSSRHARAARSAGSSVSNTPMAANSNVVPPNSNVVSSTNTPMAPDSNVVMPSSRNGSPARLRYDSRQNSRHGSPSRPVRHGSPSRPVDQNRDPNPGVLPTLAGAESLDDADLLLTTKDVHVSPSVLDEPLDVRLHSQETKHVADTYGQIYDISGFLVVEVTALQSKCVLSGTELTLRLVSEAHEPALQPPVLRLEQWTTSDNIRQAHLAKLSLDARELEKRVEDLNTVETDVKELLASLERGEEERAEELPMLLGLQGKHKERIKELRERTEVTFAYVDVRSSKAFTLQPGILTKLPWFPKPVVWCPTPIQEVMKKKRTVQKATWSSTLKDVTDHEGKDARFLYAVGGHDGTNYLASVERFDRNSQLWVPVAPMNTKRRYVGCASLAGHLYVLGGFEGSGPNLRKVDRYDPISDRWEQMAAMRTPRSGVGVAVLDGYLYAVGGFERSDTPLASVERYDPVRDVWEPVASMLTKRAGPGMGVLAGYMYAVGGYDGTRLSSVERYDPVANKWELVADMSTKRSRPGVAVLGGFVYAVGGYDGKNRLATVERYNYLVNKWKPVCSMLSPRSYPGVAAMGGRLYAAGGFNGLAQLATAESYDPQADRWTMIRTRMMTPRDDLGVASC